jgi:hypothetical protein
MGRLGLVHHPSHLLEWPEHLFGPAGGASHREQTPPSSMVLILPCGSGCRRRRRLFLCLTRKVLLQVRPSPFGRHVGERRLYNPTFAGEKVIPVRFAVFKLRKQHGRHWLRIIVVGQRQRRRLIAVVELQKVQNRSARFRIGVVVHHQRVQFQVGRGVESQIVPFNVLAKLGVTRYWGTTRGERPYRYVHFGTREGEEGKGRCCERMYI